MKSGQREANFCYLMATKSKQDPPRRSHDSHMACFTTCRAETATKHNWACAPSSRPWASKQLVFDARETAARDSLIATGSLPSGNQSDGQLDSSPAWTPWTPKWQLLIGQNMSSGFFGNFFLDGTLHQCIPLAETNKLARPGVFCEYL